jgi:hypothetical protein
MTKPKDDYEFAVLELEGKLSSGHPSRERAHQLLKIAKEKGEQAGIKPDRLTKKLSKLSKEYDAPIPVLKIFKKKPKTAVIHSDVAKLKNIHKKIIHDKLTPKQISSQLNIPEERVRDIMSAHNAEVIKQWKHSTPTTQLKSPKRLTSKKQKQVSTKKTVENWKIEKEKKKSLLDNIGTDFSPKEETRIKKLIIQNLKQTRDREYIKGPFYKGEHWSTGLEKASKNPDTYLEPVIKQTKKSAQSTNLFEPVAYELKGFQLRAAGPKYEKYKMKIPKEYEHKAISLFKTHQPETMKQIKDRLKKQNVKYLF